MKTLITLLICFIGLSHASSQNLQYAFTNGYSGNDWVYAITSDVDITGATVISGRTDYLIDFDPSAGTASCSAGLYVARYHADGQFAWLFCLGIINTETPTPVSLCTDKDGNIFLAGYFYGSADFDPSAGTAMLTDPNVNGEILFVASYDSSGNYRWSFTVPSSSTISRANAIEVDTAGNVYVSGYIDGGNEALDFDPGPGTTTIQSEAFEKFFLASYNNMGAFRWVIKARGANSTRCYGTALAVQNNGTCYLGGKFDGSCDFDPAMTNTILTTNASGARIQPFLARYDSAGNFVDVFTMPCIATSTFDVIVDDICLSPDQTKFAIAGSLAGGMYDFDPVGTYYLQTGAISYTGFAASYDTTFALNAAWSLGDTSSASYAYPRGIAFDTTGDILYAGVVHAGVYDFDPGPGAAMLTVPSPCKGFVGRHDSTGIFIQYFAIDFAMLNDLTIDSATHSITVTGTFDANGTADMDPGPASYILAPSFNSALLVARYNSLPWIITDVSNPTELRYDVFPVPASSSLKVVFQQDGERKVQLRDASGRIMLSASCNGNILEMDVSMLSSGMYILSIDESGREYREVIVVE